MDRTRKFNRAENVRQIPPGDPDFETLYERRNDAESINRHLDTACGRGDGGPRKHAPPGVAENVLATAGFADIERPAASAVFEFPDESTAWRAPRSPGLVLPALEAHGDDALRERLMAAVERCRAGDGPYRMVNELTCVAARAV